MRGKLFDGEELVLVDDWTKPEEAHRLMPRGWTGTTSFLQVSGRRRLRHLLQPRGQARGASEACSLAGMSKVATKEAPAEHSMDSNWLSFMELWEHLRSDIPQFAAR